jgi:hypothetical protein
MSRRRRDENGGIFTGFTDRASRAMVKIADFSAVLVTHKRRIRR